MSEEDENGDTITATKAFIFMLVFINGSFKAPVAYYLINSLNGEEKSLLLADLLRVLGKINIEVVSITFDGDSAHIRACELLGANFKH